jgi:hypothetical protein
LARNIIFYLTAVCEISRQHARCKGIVWSVAGNRPCSCPCHVEVQGRAA